MSLYPKIILKYFSQYSRIVAVDDDEKLSGDAERFGAEPRPRSRTLRLWLTHGILICTSVLSFMLWMRTPSTYLPGDVPNMLYSPANVAIEPVIVRYNGTLDFPSIYRGPPSPEIDAAWNRISHAVQTGITHEEMLKAGIPETEMPSKVKFSKKYGGGYIVSLESAHQMHCLNMLRKASWPESKNYSSNSASADRSHLDHCIEMMRQNIMCNADVTMIIWYWVQGHTVPYPNFNTRHRCRNFEKIRNWSVEHAVQINLSEITRFEDTVDLPWPSHRDA